MRGLVLDEFTSSGTYTRRHSRGGSVFGSIYGECERVSLLVDAAKDWNAPAVYADGDETQVENPKEQERGVGKVDNRNRSVGCREER